MIHEHLGPFKLAGTQELGQSSGFRLKGYGIASPRTGKSRLRPGDYCCPDAGTDRRLSSASLAAGLHGVAARFAQNCTLSDLQQERRVNIT
jgi:hypothetical protein